tara:strand:+ start:213 stop:461 length:249 start_codon:yes stop_codon:yes gene_type:complete
MENLIKKLKTKGERFPKKHGEWYRLKVYEDNYLIYDTWNRDIYHHKGCVSSGVGNMYGVVYTFSGYVGKVKKDMVNFWLGHL